MYLTALGGGAFGNKLEWICDAITNALDALSEWPLDVFLVHYGNEVNDQLGQHLPPRGTAQTAISTP